MQIGRIYPFAIVAMDKTGISAKEVNRPISKHFSNRRKILPHENTTHPESTLNQADATALININKIEYIIITKNLLKKVSYFYRQVRSKAVLEYHSAFRYT